MKIGFTHRSQLFRWPHISFIEFTTIEVLFNISEKIVIGINSYFFRLEKFSFCPFFSRPRILVTMKYSAKDANERSTQIFLRMGTVMTDWLEMVNRG